MACQEPPELDDIQLLTYLDDDATPDVIRHLRACRHCSARAGQLRLLEARLTTAYYRSSCPSPMDLGAYRFGRQAHKETRRIARHVAECPHCARELARLERFLSDLAPEPEADRLADAAGRIRVLVARLTGGVRDAFSGPAPALAPAYAGLRGEAAGPSIYEAGNAQVMLSAQPSGAAAGRFELLGLLTGPEPAGFTVNLWQGERHVAAIIDESGNFVFDELLPGACELLLNSPNRSIYIDHLPI
jgi:hypothetical protein